MDKVLIKIPIYLPHPIYRIAAIFKRGIRRHTRSDNKEINLRGDRDIEWSWISAHIQDGPGRTLDFGCGGAFLGLSAAQKGFDVTAIDLEDIGLPYEHPNLHFIQGDLFKLSLPQKYYDIIINCSAVEHVGMAGRFGIVTDDVDGDMAAMERLKSLMKDGGIMLLTVPVGQDDILHPLCRVYGRKRLPRLLERYSVENETFWIKNPENRWIPCSKETALDFKAVVNSYQAIDMVYALGCFFLRG